MVMILNSCLKAFATPLQLPIIGGVAAGGGHRRRDVPIPSNERVVCSNLRLRYQLLAPNTG